MKTYRILPVVAAVLMLATASQAQTTLNSTTLAAAVTNANAGQFQLTSTSNVSAGDLLAIVTGNQVREIARVNAVASPFVTVTRNAVPIPNDYGVIPSRLHAALSTVYTGAAARFYRTDVAGACTATAELYLPHISTTSGLISQCSPAGVWYRLDQTISVPCYTGALATGSVDQSCWTVDGNYVIVGITYVSKVAESGGTLTVIPRRQQGTEAPASGDALATALSGVSTVAETVTSFSLTATSALLLLSSGERLGLDFTDDVAGELLGVVVTFKIAPR